ncbi:MAG TPA: hypothetical protein VFG91_09465 [Woeseiaceae bacterium]|nr:hypothetical protein [Woeseiaceae bacterium]
MTQDLLCVLDVGKTNAKLTCIAAHTGDTVWSAQRPCIAQEGAVVRQLDIHGIEDWLLASLAAAPMKARIGTFVPIAHGAAAVLLDASNEVLAAPDYEDPRFDSVRDAYDALRDPFEATYSPALPVGLNLGRQLYLLEQQQPDLLRRCRHILLYPQYWGWRLSGAMASEITSLGCHTDLWQPLQSRYSSLAVSRGWAALLPPLRAAGAVLGRIKPDLAAAAGLDPACRVLCGLHDSNASWLCHLAARSGTEPFAVISSGTWTVVMTHGADPARLHDARDMLLNVDARGDPVATARFMGGREYEAIVGGQRSSSAGSGAAIERIIRREAMALPSFTPAGGPFAGREGRLVNAGDLDSAERSALATLYVALMTDLLLDLLGAAGESIIDGPLADNALYCALLATLRQPGRVAIGAGRSGPAQAARWLAGYGTAAETAASIVMPLQIPRLAQYRAAWRSRAGAAELHRG